MTKADSHAPPDFIGIGAPRSGTTWLAAQLQQHSDVWMPRRKELHYFSRGEQYLSTNFLRYNSPTKRFFGLQKDELRFKREFFKAMARNIATPDINQFAWDIKYFFGNYSDDWYFSLFSSREERLRGEITPAYSLLNNTDIEHISKLIPNLKIVYIMRNPIDRAWSTIKYHEKREGKALTNLPYEEQMTYLSNPAIVARSDYAKVLTQWRKYFDNSQIFTAYYEEISECPGELFSRLCQFLSIENQGKSVV